MRISLRLASALVGLVVLSGCADLITGGPLIRPGEPTGALQVINASNDRLDVILIANCNSSSYGLNRLPGGAAIRPGSSYRFIVSAGCWDVIGGTIGMGDGRGRVQVAPGRITTLRVY